jgi:hypothetical protein
MKGMKENYDMSDYSKESGLYAGGNKKDKINWKV